MKKNVKLCFVLTILLLGFFQVQAGNKWTGTNLDWTLSDSALTITGNGAMPNYTALDGIEDLPWHANCSSIKKVTVGEGVTNIGNWIFSGYSSLTSVTIPTTVTNIGKAAFADTALDSIRIPGSITSVTKIDSGAFAGCENLAFVELPPNITEIASGLFDGCKALTAIVIPPNVTSIGERAFAGTALKSVVIPRSVEIIGGSAFNNCPITSVINQSRTPQTISENVFSHSEKPDTLYIPSESEESYKSNGEWRKFDTINISIESVKLDAEFFVDSLLTDSTVQLHVIVLPKNASNVTVTWTSSDTTIATVSDGLVTASSDKDGPVTITAKTEPGGFTATCTVRVAKSGDATLRNLAVKVGETDELLNLYPNIYDYMVSVESKVESVTIKATVNYSKAKISISDGDLLKYGDNLIKIIVTAENRTQKTYKITVRREIPLGNIDNSNLQWDIRNGELTVWNKNKNGNDMMPNFKIEGKSPWDSYRQEIKTVVIGDRIRSIGDLAFFECDLLTSVTIPESVESIGMWAFHKCELSSVTIPKNVKTIGTGAFSNCKSLTYVINQSPEPQKINSNDSVFKDLTLGAITLYVPSSRNPNVANNIAYKQAGWENFKIRIFIDSITLDKKSVELHVGDTIRLNATVSPTVVKDEELEEWKWINSNGTVASIDTSGASGLVTAKSRGTAWIKFKFTTDNGSKADSCKVTVIMNRDDSTRLYSLAIDTVEGEPSLVLDPGFYPATTTYTVEAGSSVDTVMIRAEAFATTAIVSDTGKHALDYGDNFFPVTVTVTANGNTRTYTVNIRRDTLRNEFGDFNWNLANGKLSIINITAEETDMPNEYDNSIYAPWYDYRRSIREIEIGEEITHIGNRAFYNLDSVKSVSLPDSLKSIGDSAFYHCAALESITIPQKVTTIGKNAFDSCIGLQSVTNLRTVPQSISYGVNDSVFAGVPIGKRTLYVPTGCKKAYGDSLVWKSFGKIAVADTSVSIDTASVTLLTGDSIRLPWTVWPDDAEKTVNWESSDSTVATVDSGWVKASDKNAGSAIIRVTTEIGKFTDSCTVNVIKSDDATLDTIIVNDDVFELTPAFDPDSLHYTVSVEADDGDFSDIKLVVKKHYPKATVSPQPRNDTIIVSASGFGKPVEITVTAENGKDKRVYTVNVIPGGAWGQVSWTYSEGVLTFSGDGEMDDLDRDAFYRGWEKYKTSIKKIVIEEGVESIGNYIFRVHDALTVVTIPQTVTRIGEGAFSGCSALTFVTNKSLQPQSIAGKNVFEGRDLIALTLYVSNGCLAAYSEAEVWKDFGTKQVPIDSIILNLHSVGLNIDDTRQLSATVYPTPDAAETAGELVWNSKDEGVASVSNSGLVTAKSRGIAIITVRTGDNRFVDSCEVTVGYQTAIPLTGAPASAQVYLNRQVLYIDTPEAEQVSVYSVAGILLYRLEKPAGKASFALHAPGSLSNRILIVKGSSGWTGKLIIAN